MSTQLTVNLADIVALLLLGLSVLGLRSRDRRPRPVSWFVTALHLAAAVSALWDEMWWAAAVIGTATLVWAYSSLTPRPSDK